MPRFVHAGPSFGDFSSRALSAASAMVSSPRRAISTALVKSRSGPASDFATGAGSFAWGFASPAFASPDFASPGFGDVLMAVTGPASGPVSFESLRVSGPEAQADSQSTSPVSTNLRPAFMACPLP
ncbi:hypothetical protein COEX109129_37025 [Corallococcus exiguus]